MCCSRAHTLRLRHTPPLSFPSSNCSLLTQAADAGFPPSMTALGQFHTGLMHAAAARGEHSKVVDYSHPRDVACVPAAAQRRCVTPSIPFHTLNPLQLRPRIAHGSGTGRRRSRSAYRPLCHLSRRHWCGCRRKRIHAMGCGAQPC